MPQLGLGIIISIHNAPTECLLSTFVFGNQDNKCTQFEALYYLVFYFYLTIVNGKEIS